MRYINTRLLLLLLRWAYGPSGMPAMQLRIKFSLSLSTLHHYSMQFYHAFSLLPVMVLAIKLELLCSLRSYSLRNFDLQLHQNAFGGWTPPGPAGGAPDVLAGFQGQGQRKKREGGKGREEGDGKRETKGRDGTGPGYGPPGFSLLFVFFVLCFGFSYYRIISCNISPMALITRLEIKWTE